MPDPPTGAGGSGKLCTLGFLPLSETGYSLIDIFYDETMDAKYYQPGDVRNAVDFVDDGHYNAPPLYRAYDCTYVGSASFPDGDPTGSEWHEVEPEPCTYWEMTSWTDNGDGKLSVSDQFELTPVVGGPTKEFHVEWVSPIPESGDGNADLMATEKEIVPEFPLGSVAPIALIAVVAYIWWVTRRRRQEAV